MSYIPSGHGRWIQATTQKWEYYYNDGNTTELKAVHKKQDWEPTYTPYYETDVHTYHPYTETTPIESSLSSSNMPKAPVFTHHAYHTLQKVGRISWKNWGEIFPENLGFRGSSEHTFPYVLEMVSDGTLEYARIVFKTNTVQETVEAQNMSSITLSGAGAAIAVDAAAAAWGDSRIKFPLVYGGTEVMKNYKLYFVQRLRVKMTLTQMPLDPSDEDAHYTLGLPGFTMYTRTLNKADYDLMKAATAAWDPVNSSHYVGNRHDVHSVYYPELQTGTRNRTINYQFDFFPSKAHANVEVDELVGSIDPNKFGTADNTLSLSEPSTLTFGEIGWIADAHSQLNAADVWLKFKAHITIVRDVLLFDRDDIAQITVS